MEHRYVKFYWRNSYKVWVVFGKNIREITENADNLATRYHAIHFEVLEGRETS